MNVTKLCILVFAFVFTNTAAQVTDNPKVTKKSSSDVYINKIEINDEFTVFYMKYVSKSIQKQIEEYLEANPKLKRDLERADISTQRLYMQRLAMQFSEGGNTISIQPTSYLLAKNGQKFKFVKASSIPISPDRKIVEPDNRYYFRVYFEKLSPGIEEIDIIENETARNGSMSYWNFYGVEVINPVGKSKPLAMQPTQANKVEENEPTSDNEITIFGRVLDAETNEPIASKIVCIAQDSNVKFDSLITSKTGKYEFIVSPDNYLYKIFAEGYENAEEVFDISNVKSSSSFERDFYVTKIKMQSEVPPLIEDVIEPVEDANPAVIDENTFRLDKVYFETGQSTILESSYPQLEGLLEMLKNNSKMKIQVEGHTDNQGDSKLNKKLSLERAFKVREYLIQRGIEGSRIKFKGYGDAKPISPNDTEENRMKNRRVEFKVL